MTRASSARSSEGRVSGYWTRGSYDDGRYRGRGDKTAEALMSASVGLTYSIWMDGAGEFCELARGVAVHAQDGRGPLIVGQQERALGRIA